MHGRARRPVSASRLGSFDERGSKVQQGQVTYWYPIVCVLVKRDSDEPLNALKMAFGERCNSIIGRRWPLIVIYFPFVTPPIPAHRDEAARRGRCFCRTARRSRPRGRSPHSRRPPAQSRRHRPGSRQQILAQRPGRPQPYHRLDVGATGAAIESHLATPAATQGVRGQSVAFRSADDRRAGAAEDELVRGCVQKVENHRASV
jgi:hypothetical protein